MGHQDAEFKCPIWKTDASIEDRKGDKTLVLSSRAGGSYWVTGSTIPMLADDGFSNWKRIALTEMIFDAERAGSLLVIDSQLLSTLRSPRKLSVSQKIDRFLCALCETYPDFGSEFRHEELITNEDGQFLAAAINSAGSIPRDYARELAFIIDALNDIGLLKVSRDSRTARITLNGWERYEALGLSMSKSDQIFVAMWFGSEQQTSLYEQAIRPAIEAAGYVSVRIDNTQHNEKIDDQILAEIRKSKALVVDLTCGLAAPIGAWSRAEQVGAPRGGVFYEAGFATGLGLPVIWSVKKSLADEENVVHFDVRQYNQIRWTEDFSDFKERLKLRIEATMGKGNAFSSEG